MLANRVREFTLTAGTGDITLAGALPGHIAFADGFAVGDSVTYVIEDGDDYEIGTGTLTAADTLQRTTVGETLVGGTYDKANPAPISLSGNARVYCAATADFLLDPTLEADTILEQTPDGGVTVDNVLLKDGGGTFINPVVSQGAAGPFDAHVVEDTMTGTIPVHWQKQATSYILQAGGVGNLATFDLSNLALDIAGALRGQGLELTGSVGQVTASAAIAQLDFDFPESAGADRVFRLGRLTDLAGGALSLRLFKGDGTATFGAELTGDGNMTLTGAASIADGLNINGGNSLHSADYGNLLIGDLAGGNSGITIQAPITGRSGIAFSDGNTTSVASRQARFDYSHALDRFEWLTSDGLRATLSGTLLDVQVDATFAADVLIGSGVSSPVDALHVASSAGGGDVPRLRFTNDGTGHTAADGAIVGISNTSDFDIFNYESNGSIRLGVGSGIGLTIDNTNATFSGEINANAGSSAFSASGAAGVAMLVAAPDQVAANGLEYGAISWTPAGSGAGASPRVAFGPVQQSIDSDVLGLNFYVHPSAVNADPMELALTLNANKSAVFAGDVTVPNGSAFNVGGATDTLIGSLRNNLGVLELLADGTRDIQIGGSTGGTAIAIDTSDRSVDFASDIVTGGLIRGGADTDTLIVAAGTSTGFGGNVLFYGAADPTAGGDTSFRSGSNPWLYHDVSFSTATLSADLDVAGDMLISQDDGTGALLDLFRHDVSITSGDIIGLISATGYDLSTKTEGGRIEFEAAADWDGATPGYSATNILFYTQSNTGTDQIAAGPVLSLEADGRANFHGNTLQGVPSVIRGTSGNELVVSGGSDWNAGGGITLYGENHLSQANDIELRTGITTRLQWDYSANYWDWHNHDLVNVGKLTVDGGAKISIQNQVDGGSGQGIFLWDTSNTGYGIYMASPGANKSLSDGIACTPFSGGAGVSTRIRVSDVANQSLIFENSSEQCLMELTASTGDLYTRGDINVGGSFNLGTPTELTISGGAISVTKSYHKVDTEADAATDDLVTINGGNVGDRIVLSSTSSARAITLKDITSGGNLQIAGDFSLGNPADTIELIFDGFNWLEISRSNNG